MKEYYDYIRIKLGFVPKPFKFILIGLFSMFLVIIINPNADVYGPQFPLSVFFAMFGILSALGGVGLLIYDTVKYLRKKAIK